jgi:hypothetical protein
MGRHKRARSFASIGIPIAGVVAVAIAVLIVIVIARPTGRHPAVSAGDRQVDSGQVVSSTSSADATNPAVRPDALIPAPMALITVATPPPAPPVAVRPRPSAPKTSASPSPSASASTSASRSRGPIPPIPPRPTSTAVPVVGSSCSPFGRTAQTATGQTVSCRFNSRRQLVWTLI